MNNRRNDSATSAEKTHAQLSIKAECGSPFSGIDRRANNEAIRPPLKRGHDQINGGSVGVIRLDRGSHSSEWRSLRAMCSRPSTLRTSSTSSRKIPLGLPKDPHLDRVGPVTKRGFSTAEFAESYHRVAPRPGRCGLANPRGMTLYRFFSFLTERFSGDPATKQKARPLRDGLV